MKMEIIEIRNPEAGLNLSGHDSSTPYGADALLECGHRTRIGGGSRPAYNARKAVEAAYSWVGVRVHCATCAEYPKDRIGPWVGLPFGYLGEGNKLFDLPARIRRWKSAHPTEAARADALAD